MKKSGLKSLVIKNNYGTIVGICDLKVADEAYLSLLMLDAKIKGNGYKSKAVKMYKTIQ